jgi:hypothetical protein
MDHHKLAAVRDGLFFGLLLTCLAFVIAATSPSLPRFVTKSHVDTVAGVAIPGLAVVTAALGFGRPVRCVVLCLLLGSGYVYFSTKSEYHSPVGQASGASKDVCVSAEAGEPAGLAFAAFLLPILWGPALFWPGLLAIVFLLPWVHWPSLSAGILCWGDVWSVALIVSTAIGTLVKTKSVYICCM